MLVGKTSYIFGMMSYEIFPYGMMQTYRPAVRIDPAPSRSRS